MNKRPITPTYIFFYILFSADTYRILIGVFFSALATPYIIKPDMGISGKIVIAVMLATIGYAGSMMPGRWIANKFKEMVLGDKAPK